MLYKHITDSELEFLQTLPDFSEHSYPLPDEKGYLVALDYIERHKPHVSEIIPQYKAKQRLKCEIRSSYDIASFAQSDWEDLDLVESVRVMLMDNGSKPYGMHLLSRGGWEGAQVDIRALMSLLLITRCTRFILIHNHPSGVTKPSRHDIELTKRIKQAAEFLNLSFVDHVIVSRDAYFSFRDEGML